ncbi:hypothetical protein AV274_5292 [Blastocystis sp. ATCC 50177/Nand II]|uniref:Uncharacterized protein n=1 Tax=Blastocystis sp. subtype 1 (strain ATCC 50177 / NandII) TaxID=478820 RepID=A0A196SAH3_BLAHN|nr:hypothetical protein AV274_5292 [Blastocystis sp. ATCC 50177/Nand II]
MDYHYEIESWLSRCSPLVVEVGRGSGFHHRLHALFYQYRMKENQIELLLLFQGRPTTNRFSPLTSFFTNTMGRLLRGHSATIRRLLYQRICFSASLRQDEPPWVVIEWSQSDDIWSRKEQAGSPSSMVLCGTYWGWKREGDHPIIFIDPFLHIHSRCPDDYAAFAMPMNTVAIREGGVKDANEYARHLPPSVGLLQAPDALLHWRQNRVTIFPTDPFQLNSPGMK